MRAAKNCLERRCVRRDLLVKSSHFERERETISRIANPRLLSVKKHFECAFFKFFFRDMYSATITSFKQKELLMQFNIKNFSPSSWLVRSAFAILDLLCQHFFLVLSIFSILVFIIIGNCFGEDGLGVNPERLPLKDESSL